MTGIALRFGPLGPPGCTVKRSGLRWLHPSGHLYRPGEIAAYGNIIVATAAGVAFADERLDLHVALAPRRAGRLRHAREPWEGGFLDRVPVARWDADGVWAQFDPHGAYEEDDGDTPRLMFLAARRFVDFAEHRAGLLTGWHDRARAWWGDDAPNTLLALGTCEQRAMLGGEEGAFAELFERCAAPMQVVLAQDEPQVPCARTLVEQLDRTPETMRAIRDDLACGLLGGDDAPGAADWLFAGALLNALERSPLQEAHDILTTRALLRAAPPRAIMLSVTAELPQALRHRRLGYMVNCHPFRLRAAGAAVRRWLRAAFEPVTRTPALVRDDYRALLDRLAGHATLFVVNAVATNNFAEMSNYALPDDATMASIGTVRAGTLNLMLHDLATRHDLVIVDADALAAELGVAMHLRDGVHASRSLNTAMREDVLRQLGERRDAGFSR